MSGRLRRALARAARLAPARVFVVEGDAPPYPPDLLRLHPLVQLVDSPRSATILLIAGEPAPALEGATHRVHDQMATPRRTVMWCHEGAEDRIGVVPHALVIAGDASTVAMRLSQLQAALLSGAETSESPLLPDVEPAQWRGVGPFGQGGTGMTGGVPYGRPMAETAPDRDGLRLDRLDVRIGPFFPPFPPGLVLSVGLQGDIVQDVAVGDNPFMGMERPVRDDLFRRALTERVPLADLELRRARHHLRWVAHALRVHGLGAVGQRALALSEALMPGDVQPVIALHALLERTRALSVATDGVGIIPPELVRGRGLGPVARASGVAEDARAEDDAYLALGFEPIVTAGQDARGRWRQRLAEAVQSISIAARAGDTAIGGGSSRNGIESARGLLTASTSPLDALLALVPELLPGSEWGDAVTTIVSLDIDLRDLPPLPSAPSAAGRDTAGRSSAVK